MSLTKFGAAIRESRRNLDLTLSTMATALHTSPAFLSAMETGRSKVPMDWVERIAGYFQQKGQVLDLNWLKILASESNESVSLAGLPPYHKMLIAGFANSELNQQQLTKLGELLSEIYGEKAKDAE